MTSKTLKPSGNSPVLRYMVIILPIRGSSGSLGKIQKTDNNCTENEKEMDGNIPPRRNIPIQNEPKISLLCGSVILSNIIEFQIPGTSYWYATDEKPDAMPSGRGSPEPFLDKADTDINHFSNGFFIHSDHMEFCCRFFCLFHSSFIQDCFRFIFQNSSAHN